MIQMVQINKLRAPRALCPSAQIPKPIPLAARTIKKSLHIQRQVVAAVCLIGLSGALHAVPVYDQAQVVRTVPVYETVSYHVPVEQCRTEAVAYTRNGTGQRSATAPIIGAIIGGALGNAVGHKKRNQQVGTVVGAVLGGSIGADIARRHEHGYPNRDKVIYRDEEVCSWVDEVREESRLTGYDVSYQYAGQTYRSRMPHDPGETVRVRVNVRPAE